MNLKKKLLMGFVELNMRIVPYWNLVETMIFEMFKR
jgi:hypothetical protein